MTRILGVALLLATCLLTRGSAWASQAGGHGGHPDDMGALMWGMVLGTAVLLATPALLVAAAVITFLRSRRRSNNSA